MTDRISSYEEFWPHYLSEHRDPRSRRLHFAGTTGFLASVIGSAIMHPVAFPSAMAGFAGIFAHGVKHEGEKKSFAHVAAMLALPAMASPVLFPAGVVFAYGCAWRGHFKYEKNRPATFEYPLWSLLSDFKMYGEMLRGRLWSGDPLEELGLEDPARVIRDEDAPMSTVHA